VVRDLPAGLAAGVEARHAARALPMQREQAEAFALFRCRDFAARAQPFFENGFGFS